MRDLLKAERVVLDYSVSGRLDAGQRALLDEAYKRIAQVTTEMLTQDDTEGYDDEDAES